MSLKSIVIILAVLSVPYARAQTRLISAFEETKDPDEKKAHEASSRFLRDIMPLLAELDADPNRDLDIQYLVTQFSDKSDYVRLQASAVLATAEMLCRPLAIDRHFFPAIYKLLGDTGPRTRENAIRILAYSREPKPHLEAEDVAQVLGLLTDDAKRVRQTAADAALSERPLREATIRAVVARFPADPDLQQSILWAIGELRITDRLALDLLIECLNSGSERNRLDALTALGKFGAAGAPALPALRNLLGSPDEVTRKTAADVIALVNK
jgi:hypothetical protein